MVGGLIQLMLQSAYAGSISLPQASTVAAGVDAVSDFVFYWSVFFTIAIPAVIVYFVIKYHRSRKGRQTAYIAGHHGLEVIWTVGPLILMLIIFWMGYQGYVNFRKVDANAIEVNVVGRQWLWQFQYTDGRQAMNDLVVPLNKPVKLIMTSEDVIHSFYVPNFRVKQDVVPGSYYYVTFQATIPGPHRIFCAEYCGTGHSDMLGVVYVLEEKDYATWQKTGKIPAEMVASMGQTVAASDAGAAGTGAGKPKTLAEQGAALYSTKGCVACHSVDGSRRVGPSWKGVYGSKEELESGKSVEVDENYIRESIVEPQAKVVKGYPPSMPTFKGLLSDQEINALIAYIKSLK